MGFKIECREDVVLQKDRARINSLLLDSKHLRNSIISIKDKITTLRALQMDGYFGENNEDLDVVIEKLEFLAKHCRGLMKSVDGLLYEINVQRQLLDDDDEEV